MMIRDVFIILQNLLKIDLKTPKIAKVCIFIVHCVIFVAMATRRMNLWNVLFLNYEQQELLFTYEDETYLYKSTKVAQN